MLNPHFDRLIFSKQLLAFAFLFTPLIALELHAQKAFSGQQQTIINTIQTSYVEGLMNEGDTMKIDQGFHPSFVMTGLGDKDELWVHPIDKWRAQKIEARKAGKLPRPAEKTVTLNYHFIDITGNTAVAKVDYNEGGITTYVDYISLYRINGQWRIISKIFHKVE
jgi:hypothetical protein